MICGVCGASPPVQGSDIETMLANCPLTPLLPPLGKRWGNRYKLQELQTRGRGSLPQQPSMIHDRGKILIDKVTVEPITPPTTPTQPGISMSFKQSKSRPSPPPFSRTLSTPNSILSSPESVDLPTPESTPPTVIPVSTTNAKKLDLRRASFRFEEVADDKIPEVQAAGYLLWEFRPMDNTFMEAWGKVDQFPRYRWERPDVMDRDVAVTVEYAKAVLAGRQKHKWSRVEPEDVVMAEIADEHAITGRMESVDADNV